MVLLGGSGNPTEIRLIEIHATKPPSFPFFAEQEDAEGEAGAPPGASPGAPAGAPAAAETTGGHGAASVVLGLGPDGGTSDEEVEVLPDPRGRLRTEDLDKGPPLLVLVEKLVGDGEVAIVFGGHSLKVRAPEDGKLNGTTAVRIKPAKGGPKRPTSSCRAA